MSNPRGGGGGSLHELVFQVFLFFILKVFIEFVTILLLFFFFLIWPGGMWYLGSLTKD